MAVVEAKKSHTRLKRDIEKVLNKHAGHLSAQEVLAVMSQMVGIAVALQDQRAMLPEQAMEIVAKNIEMGNQSVVDELINTTGGNA